MKSVDSVFPEHSMVETRLMDWMFPRRTTFVGSLLVAPWLLAAAGAPAFAQTHHIAPPEKVTRAIGVYEWTGDLSKPKASRLVPVSLFINGHFEDAGLYMARPVPFALETGNIYSVELGGEEKGTYSLEHAADFTTGRLLPDQDPVGAWYGFGRFAPLAPPKPPPALHASAHLPVIVSSSSGSSSGSDSGRPHLTTKADTPAKSTGDASSKDSGGKDTKDSSTTPDSGSGKTPMGDDPDRPTLGRRTGSDADGKGSDSTDAGSGGGSAGSGGGSAGSGSAGSGSKSSSDNDPERPSLRKRNPENTGKKSPPSAGVTGPDRPLTDDPDRPIIRHRKKPVDEEDSELKTMPPDMHQVAAVSDPSRRDPHPFARGWESNAERADVLAKLQVLARAQASAYLAQNHLTPGTAPLPVSPASTGEGASRTTAPEASTQDKNAPVLRRTPGGVNTSTASSAATAPKATPTAKPAPAAIPAKGHSASVTHKIVKPAKAALPAPLLLNAEQLTGYTLSYGGLATFVYTAQIPTTEGPPVYVTVVAQRLPSGEMQMALHSVTDANHLDRTPWMRPVDAVDPDASHRASLLFELRAHSSRQFALYRLISAQAEQQFVSGAIE